LEPEDLVGTKFYCLHALADVVERAERFRIREKTLEFSQPHSDFNPLGDVGLHTGPIGGLCTDGNISPQRRKTEK